MSKLKLEQKMQDALIGCLKQQPLLKKVDFKPAESEAPRLNGDIVVSAKRLELNPPVNSGIYNLAVTVTMRVRMKPGDDSLADFQGKDKAIENIFMTAQNELIKQLTAQVGDFHCYEFLVVSYDDTPEDNAHKCIWGCTAIAMALSFKTAENLN